MLRLSRFTLLALVCVLTLIAMPALAHAQRKAPRGFFGVVYSPVGPAAPWPDIENHFSRIAAARGEAVRIQFSWGVVEPSPGELHWEVLDPAVRAAAQNNLDLLPIVYATPRWASSRPDRPNYFVFAPRDQSTYARFLQALIGRYGPNGSFWAENPGVPRHPIRAWQIWNEPSAEYFWGTPNYQRSYPRLLRVAYRAIHRADRKAKVVTAGLTSFLQETGRQTTSWQDLRAFYRNGIKRHFDVLAVHPFSRKLSDVVKTIEFNRRVMRRFRDGRKPIWATELSFLGSKGRVPRRRYLGLEVSASKQRKLLAAAYARFIRDRRLRVRRAFWYAWASTYTATPCIGNQPSFQFVGLVKTPCGGFTFTPTPLLSTYARTAGRF